MLYKKSISDTYCNTKNKTQIKSRRNFLCSSVNIAGGLVLSSILSPSIVKAAQYFSEASGYQDIHQNAIRDLIEEKVFFFQGSSGSLIGWTLKMESGLSKSFEFINKLGKARARTKKEQREDKKYILSNRDNLLENGTFEKFKQFQEFRVILFDEIIQAGKEYLEQKKTEWPAGKDYNLGITEQECLDARYEDLQYYYKWHDVISKNFVDWELTLEKIRSFSDKLDNWNTSLIKWMQSHEINKDAKKNLQIKLNHVHKLSEIMHGLMVVLIEEVALILKWLEPQVEKLLEFEQKTLTTFNGSIGYIENELRLINFLWRKKVGR